MAEESPDQEGRDRRIGRGHLSSIELLPEEAEADVHWALEQLRERKVPQSIILVQFNARLAARGIAPISKGAFSRYSVRNAIEMRKLEASREITDAVLSRMAPEDRTDSTLAAVELMKFRILSLIMDAEEPDPKLLGQAALALSRLSSTALREAEGQRRDRRDKRDQADEEEQRRKDAETAQKVAEIGAKAGVSQGALQKITSLLTTGAY